MRSTGALLATLCLFAVTSAPDLEAGEPACAGNPGLVLTLQPQSVPLGSNFILHFQAPAGNLVILVFSPSGSPTPTPYGTLCVGPPLLSFPFVMTASTKSFPHFIACNESDIGVTGHFQFLTTDPNQADGVGVSNHAAIDVIDSACAEVPFPGEVLTFSQRSVGQDCSGGNVPACILAQHFNELFPNGLVLGVGDPDTIGTGTEGSYSILLTSAAAVAAFLPTSGPPGSLSQDHVNPISATEAGELAGQLAAAKITMRLDQAGFLDYLKDSPEKKLAGMVYNANVDEDFFDRLVMDMIHVGDQVLSCVPGDPLDLDRDGTADVTVSDLSVALERFNSGFAKDAASGSVGFPQ